MISVARDGYRVCAKCGVSKPFTREFWGSDKRYSHGLKAYCKPCMSKCSNLSHQKKRIKVLTHYSKGKPCCSCCGEDEIIVLNLDHIDGGGTRHRNSITISIFAWIIKNNFPEGYRVLCRNCDWCFRMLGACYHNKQGET